MWSTFKENIQAHFTGRPSGKESTQSQSTTNDAMKNVVTPHSIPKFIVPPLNPGELINSSNDNTCIRNNSSQLVLSDNADENLQTLELESSFQNPSGLPNNSSPASKSKIGENNKKINQQQHPGLTLQHLLSTKAGFSTLTESPNTRRKESLFLSPPLPIRGKSFTPNMRRTGEFQFSSSDSDPSRNTSPVTSPLNKLKSRRLLVSSRSGYDSDSNSSRQSTPFASPAGQRKLMKKKSFEACVHSNVTEVGTPRPLHDCTPSSYDHNKSPISPTQLQSTDKIKRSYSASNIVHQKVNVIQKQSSASMEIPQIKVKLTYIAAQEKMNISILEAESFYIGRPVYLKIGLLPRYYGYQRTDTIRVTSSTATLQERMTFESVKEEDIPHMSLEVSCKEKQGRLRTPTLIGKSIITLSEINKQAPNDFVLDLKPPDLKQENVHIQLSLCYDAMLGFVVAEVIGVRNIPKGSLGRYPDSYVVLTEEPQCDKNKKKQTEIKHRTKDPTFNRSFVFSMSSDKLVIVVTLFLKDKVKGQWTAKGEVKLGQDVEHWSGQAHWVQALSHAGKPVTFWHRLTPP